MFTLGGDLKRKEKLSGRLGDVLSHLQIASATLKYYYDNGRPADEWPIVSWSLQMCCYKAQEAFYGFFENFTYPLIGSLLKGVTFPWGRAFSLPSDKLGKEIAQMMLTPSPLRQKLTDICFIGKSEDDSTGIMERGFLQCIANQPLMDKINKAVKQKEISKHLPFEEKCQAALGIKIIDENEHRSLLEYESIRKKVIAVDEFAPDYALGTQNNAEQNK
jgi:hypothetical protein